MAIDANQLREEVNANIDDNAALERCVAVAKAILDQHLADQELDLTVVPAVIQDEAHLAVAVEQWHLRNAPNGVLAQQFGDPDTGGVAPVRIGGDPLRAARQILAPWTTPAIG